MKLKCDHKGIGMPCCSICDVTRREARDPHDIFWKHAGTEELSMWMDLVDAELYDESEAYVRAVVQRILRGDSAGRRN